jgi:TetR/AcrR family tetracycline transcriptional repressor
MRAVSTKKRASVRGSIDKDTIVQAALRLLERDGIAGVSTRQVADALGIAGPSLYWHFKDKQQLLNHVAEAILAEAQPSPNPLYHEPEWRKWLEKAARAYRSAALSRRDAALVLAGARPTGTHPELDYAHMVARLTSEGFPEGKAPFVIWSLGRFALGWAVREQAAGARRPGQSDEAFEYGLDALLTGFEALRRRRPRSLQPRKRI